VNGSFGVGRFVRMTEPTQRRVVAASVFAALALAAFFQARGLGGLWQAAFTVRPSARAVAPPPMVASTRPLRGASAILEGNAFARPEPAAPAVPDVTTASSEAPAKCDFGYVRLIAASRESAWSFASIEIGGKSELFRVGDAVAEHTVAAIGWRRVWLEGPAGRCHMKLGDAPRKQDRRTPAAPKKKQKRSPRLPAALAAGIERVSADEVSVERRTADAIFADAASLLRSTRVQPAHRDGELIGLKLARVPAGSLLHTLGLRRGDVLRSLNGYAIGDPQQALQAYGRLQRADRLDLAVERGGAPRSLTVTIR
jgi:general secretion pathway protein C